MDALPVRRTPALDYTSMIDGAMHACGHDLHTAMLVGAARLLCARRAELPGTWSSCSSPARRATAAPDMIAEGVLDAAGRRPVAALRACTSSSGLLPRGLFATRPGP